MGYGLVHMAGATNLGLEAGDATLEANQRYTEFPCSIFLHPPPFWNLLHHPAPQMIRPATPFLNQGNDASRYFWSSDHLIGKIDSHLKTLKTLGPD